MASRPIQRKFLSDLRARGGWDALFERVANGERMADIAASFGISRTFLHHVITVSKVRDRLTAARKIAAEHLFEEAGRIVDDAPADRDALTKARLQSEHRMKHAAILDRDTYGERPAPGPVVNFNVGQLHLDALRQQRAEIEAAEVRELTAPKTEPEP